MTTRSTRLGHVAMVALTLTAVAAHNKVMIIDGALSQAVVVTGSYNYTSAAQARNAENVLIVRHDPALASQYRANFVRLRERAQRYESGSQRR
jgi:phosphatidylserine/phosphatidylglycerophosphate/cardiolipin synthase-like enzyme